MSLFFVKMYIRAKTPDELIREQLRNNIKHSQTFSYSDIYKSRDGYWYAWFLADAKGLVRKDINDGIKKDG